MKRNIAIRPIRAFLRMIHDKNLYFIIICPNETNKVVSSCIGGSREGPGGHVPPPLDNWTVPLLHRFHGLFMGGPGGHVRPKPYWTVPLLRGF